MLIYFSVPLMLSDESKLSSRKDVTATVSFYFLSCFFYFNHNCFIFYSSRCEEHDKFGVAVLNKVGKVDFQLL